MANGSPRVRLPRGSLILDRRKQWSAEGDVRPQELAKAQDIADDYIYSPAHGYPGYYLTQIVARALGGQAILPPTPPSPPGAIY